MDLLARLDETEPNTLFARAVVRGDAHGTVVVETTASYVAHAYGMSILLGDGAPDDDTLAAVLARPRAADEWLQLWPLPWAARFDALAPGTVERHTRVNFAFSRDRVRPARPRDVEVVRADRACFDMPGSVVPRAFWRDADQFVRHGAGFAVHADGAIASLAFSAFVTARQLELGIETLPHHRGRGLAAHACTALIDHCLERDLEPVWACRAANAGSMRLASSLGFVPSLTLPYFRLPPSSRPTA